MRKHIANSQAMHDNTMTFYIEECTRISAVLDELTTNEQRAAHDHLYDELSRIDHLMDNLIMAHDLIGTR